MTKRSTFLFATLLALAAWRAPAARADLLPPRDAAVVHDAGSKTKDAGPARTGDAGKSSADAGKGGGGSGSSSSCTVSRSQAAKTIAPWLLVTGTALLLHRRRRAA